MAEATQSRNPFAEIAWETGGGDMLPVGDHLVTIDSIDGTGTSSGGHPQVEVKASNDEGSITDWMVTIPSSTFRVTALFAACDLERPTDDEWGEDGTGFRLTPAYLNQCVGKKVGVRVREERSMKEPDKYRKKVRGWLRPAEVSPNGGLPAADFSTPGSAPGDDIPF